MPFTREQYAEKLLVAVNEAAGAVSSRFVTFVSVGAYVAVTVAATTHEMLLRAASLVTLPLLNAQIPIIGPFGFYSIAPWLIVLLHSDLLLQLSILSNELDRFDEEASGLPEDEQTMLRQRVANFYYVLYLAGQAPTKFLHVLSAFITWVTTVVLPLALLLWIQIRFLPFHSPVDTWMHRAAIFADVVLILFILMPRLWNHWRKRDGASLVRRLFSVPVLIFAACTVVVGVSVFVATIPDDADAGPGWFAQNMQLRERVLTANVLSPEDINALRDSPPDELPSVLSKVTPFQALQGRDFRYADLYNAVLPKLDLRAIRTEEPREQLPADCETRRDCVDPPECVDSGLDRTRLAGANFGWASMQQAMLDDAVLDGADMSWAKVQYGSFTRAQMNTANMSSARLASARFDDAKACGARFDDAEMPSTSLVRARLRGASLRGANLEKANLEGADLRGADLSGANLNGAILRNAQLEGAAFRGAKMEGILLEGADVQKTDLSGAAAAAARTDFLADLACDNAATAHGIALQALESPARDGAKLAQSLLARRRGAGCPGLADLPNDLHERLIARAGMS